MTNIICRCVGFPYPGSAEPVFHKLELLISTHWRCALVGRNGCGKSTLLKLLMGELAVDSGSVSMPEARCLFPGARPSGDVIVTDAVKDAAGPFRAWETQMAGLLEAGDTAASSASATWRRSTRRVAAMSWTRESTRNSMRWVCRRNCVIGGGTAFRVESVPVPCWLLCLFSPTAIR